MTISFYDITKFMFSNFYIICPSVKNIKKKLSKTKLPKTVKQKI